jgi:HEAT repeat protein
VIENSMDVTFEAVQQLLQSQDYGDRLRGVNQLRYLKPDEAFGLMQHAIADANARVRYAAVCQMPALGTQDLALSRQILQDRLHHDKEVDVQSAAADAIGALKLTDLFEDLQTSYHQSSEWLLKFSIVAALGDLGSLQAFALLEDALGSDNELLKTAAIGSFGELGDRRAVPLLIPYATHPDWQIRYRVMQALSYLGGDEARQTLHQLMDDPVEQVAQEARKSLG